MPQIVNTLYCFKCEAFRDMFFVENRETGTLVWIVFRCSTCKEERLTLLGTTRAAPPG
jgi:hypothetical protein